MAAEQLDRVAEVPMALGKGLCACFGCKLVKTQQQVDLQAHCLLQVLSTPLSLSERLCGPQPCASDGVLCHQSSVACASSCSSWTMAVKTAHT